MKSGTMIAGGRNIRPAQDDAGAGSADARYACTVGAFNWMIPHYRQALFAMLSEHPTIEFNFCAPRRYHDPTIKIGEFGRLRYREIRSWQWKIPFLPQYLTFQPQTIAAVIGNRYDVMILLNDIAGLDVWISLVLARMLNRRIVLWGQGLSKSPTVMRIWLRKLMMGLSRAVLFYTEGGREFWIRQGVPPAKLFVAYNTIDTRRIFAIKDAMTACELHEYRALRGWGDKKIIVFDGRLVPSKRIDIVLTTMKRVIEYDANVHLAIIGDGPLRGQIRSMIERLDIPHMVTMLGPLYNEHEIACVYMNSSAALLPAFAGLAIVHAFAYGVPLVMGRGKTGHGPEAELVRDGENGFICTLESIDEFVSSICRLLGSPSLQKKMSCSALQMVTEKYNLENMAAGIVDAVQYSAAH